MASMRRALFLALLAAVAGGTLFWAFRPRPIAAEMAVVAEGRFRATVEVDGRTRVRERYVVSAPLAGRILRVAAKPGDAVTAGSTVATILPSLPALLDPRTRRELEERIGAAEASVAEANARLERAQALARQSEADVRRVRTLRERGVAAAQQLEREELALTTNERDVRAAELRKHAAEHELEQARALLRRYDEPDGAERLTVSAPVSGRVLRVLQESESIVAGGAALLEIGDARDLEVIADVLTTDAVAIRPGAPVSIERWGGPDALAGQVRLVEPGAFTKVSALGVEEQRVWVVIDITSPREDWAGLGDAFRVEARIVVEEIPVATVVPASALFRRGEGWAAFVVEDGRARERPVGVLRRSGPVAAVETGLRPGERVVVFPPSTIRDGASVRE